MIREHVTPILRLMQRLAAQPLDRIYERHGGFSTADAGVTTFFGQFEPTQELFWVETDEPAIVAAITMAITANTLREDYLGQGEAPPAGYDPDQLTIRPVRFSETQGEVELCYAGRRVEQFGDRILLTAHGWRGYPDVLWRVTGERMARAFASRAVSPFREPAAVGALQ